MRAQAAAYARGLLRGVSFRRPPTATTEPTPLRVRFGHGPLRIALAASVVIAAIAALSVPNFQSAAVTGLYARQATMGWFVVFGLGGLALFLGVAPIPPTEISRDTYSIIVRSLLLERTGSYVTGWMLVSLAGGLAHSGAHGVPLAIITFGLSCGLGWRIRQTHVDHKAIRRWRDNDTPGLPVELAADPDGGEAR